MNMQTLEVLCRECIKPLKRLVKKELDGTVKSVNGNPPDENGNVNVSGSGSGDGTPGGYYTPAVTQTDDNTMRVSYTASQEGMEAVPDVDVTLPHGPTGATGPAGADGKDGAPGADGKDGVGVQSIEQTTTSTEDGGTNIITATLTDGTTATFQVKNGSQGSTGPAGADGKAGADGATGPAGTDGKTAYEYAKEGGYTGTEDEFRAKMVEELPDALPNPNALTFTGAVTGSYDGSKAVTVEIPSGGGSGENAEKPLRLVRSLKLEEAADAVNINTDNDGNHFLLSECYLWVAAKVTESCTLNYIPNGIWVSNTYAVSKVQAATDYSYVFLFHAFGSPDMFFGYEILSKGNNFGGNAYNVAGTNRESWDNYISSFKVTGSFDAGAEFYLYGRDAG